MSHEPWIYLNSAGTSWPKPPGVLEAIEEAHRAPPEAWPGMLERAHGAIAEFFGVPEPSRFLLTGGCTVALAVALGDLPWREGDRVITSSLEHHALLRPITKLVRERGVEHYAAPYGPGEPIALEAVEAELKRGGVRLLAFTMASNVTGEILPARELVEMAHEHGALCLVDAAQTAGTWAIDVKALGADLFVFAGHKGPQGPHGIGGLYAAPGVAMESPAASCDLRAGPAACSPFPSYCDVGSVNLAAACGLEAGLRWLRERGVEAIGEHLRELARELSSGVESLPGVTLYGAGDWARRTSAISIGIEGRSLPDIAARLRAEHRVIASAGQQCAPLAHETLGTALTGTLRLSSGPLSSREQIHRAIEALRAVLRG